MNSIWQSLPRPFLILAPMEGVTDTVFRQIVAGCASPDVFMTEFTSADGFCSDGRDAVADNFRFSISEQPIIAQIWGKNPDTMFQTAQIVSTMGFGGIDINMGCPDRTVMHHGCGGALINTPEIAAQIIRAVKDGSGGLPVSVKTRLGFSRIQTETWITFLLEQGIEALIVHGRTVSELSRVPAHWDEIGKVVRLRDNLGVSTRIVGNGDVKDAKDAQMKYEKYNVDGVMIGRGIFTNLWAFDRSPIPHIPNTRELLELMKKHIQLYVDTWGSRKNFVALKKYFKIYVNGFTNASDIRQRFMEVNNPTEAFSILDELSRQSESS